MGTKIPTLGLLQLIALTIPAIAILKQVICSLNQRHHEYSGWNVIVTSSRGSETREFQYAQWSLISMSVAGILLGINILIPFFGFHELLLINIFAISAIITGLGFLIISVLLLDSKIIRVDGLTED